MVYTGVYMYVYTGKYQMTYSYITVRDSRCWRSAKNSRPDVNLTIRDFSSLYTVVPLEVHELPATVGVVTVSRGRPRRRPVSAG